ncbi:MAG: DUF362 domain-containing protein [Dehalococcoidia bacterium]|nr:DUF362 domain-containing protein [Dehalococcoidia bacterium]
MATSGGMIETGMCQPIGATLTWSRQRVVTSRTGPPPSILLACSSSTDLRMPTCSHTSRQWSAAPTSLTSRGCLPWSQMTAPTIPVSREVERRNRYLDQEGRSLVSVVRTAGPGSAHEWLKAAVDAIGGFNRTIRHGDSVFIKPNFNAAGGPPVSTDLAFLRAIIDLAHAYGAARVVVGESSRHPPTSARNVMQLLGVFDLCRDAGAEAVVLGEGSDPWVEVPIAGRYFKTIQVARPALECDSLIYSGVLKTHRWSRFSMSLKLSVGLLRPRDRIRLHLGGHFQQRIIELASAFNPDLVLLDGREAFIKGGPSWGRRGNPRAIIASGDRVAADVAAIRCLQEVPGCNLRRDPWTYPQIREAARMGLGAADDSQMALVEVP